MREIKFRAWDKSRSAMRELDAIFFGRIRGTIASVVTIEQDRIPRYASNQANMEGNYILMQYTGLKDKNGKEIYEGDIVRSVLPGNPELVKDFIVEWEYDETTGAIGFMILLEAEDREIIGNIHENPELLK